jgi:hypothetical protein
MTAPTWTDHQREILAAVADLLIPASDEMPSASAAGVAAEGIDEIAPIRPDLHAAAVEAVEIIGGSPPDSVASLRLAIPDHFAAVSELLASAYFLRPEVARLVGYRSRVAIPLDDELLRRAELRRLAEPVIARGNVWRRTEGP